MECKKILMTGLIGFAMLATPIVAAAQNHDSARSFTQQSQSRSNHDESASRSYNAPARNVAPAQTARHDSRDERGTGAWKATPAVMVDRDGRGDRDDRGDRDVRTDRDFRTDRDDRGRWDRDHDFRYYADPVPYYVMPYGYAGGACAWARHLRAVYNQDRYTGHPAAANDLLPQLQRAERACGVPYGYNR
jgi:hypothetical protein